MKPTIEDLIALRKKGWSSDKIAQLYGLPYTVVSHLLNSTCRLVDAEKPKALSMNDEILSLRRAGMKQSDIAKKLGVSQGLVCLVVNGKLG